MGSGCPTPTHGFSLQLRTMTLDVAAPASLAQPLTIPLKTMTGPGPSNCSERVLKAQSLPTIGHLHPEFCKVMDDIKAGVQYIFQTKNTTTFALSATGHAAMECVMNNMLEPGRTVLICNNGIYHHTGPVNTMYGPREGLAMVAEEGLE